MCAESVAKALHVDSVDCLCMDRAGLGMGAPSCRDLTTSLGLETRLGTLDENVICLIECVVIFVK